MFNNAEDDNQLLMMMMVMVMVLMVMIVVVVMVMIWWCDGGVGLDNEQEEHKWQDDNINNLRGRLNWKKLSLAPVGLPSSLSQLYRAFIWKKAVPWIRVNNRGWERSTAMRMLKRCSCLGFCLGTPRQSVYMEKTEEKLSRVRG